MAVRVCLGANRIRLLRHTLTESLLLSLIGSAVGTLLAYFAVGALIRMFSSGRLMAGVPVRFEGLRHPDAGVLLFTGAIALLTGLACGAAPAISASNTTPASALQSGTKIGETKLATFRVTNNADHPITGRAVFNVVPEQAGAYFQKLECFCFSDQTIGAHQTVDMPVLYFVDPKYVSDPDTKNEPDVTLSYTFFPVGASASTDKTADNGRAKPSSALGAGA